ncbi:MAG: hypothetical protein AAGI23_04945 [Bacteroidota bacterium]
MRHYFLLLCTFVLSFSLQAQRQIGGIPLSFATAFDGYRTEIPQLNISSPDAKTLQNIQQQSTVDVPLQSIPMQTNVDLKTDGKWIDLPNDNQLWQLQIEVKGANGLIVFYEDFHLPMGSKLFVYSSDRRQILGAYTSQNNSKSEQFLTGIIEGESLVIEYYEPAKVRGEGRFRIPRIDYVFEVPTAMMFGFGTADSCQTNINCNTTSDIQQLKRGACRIMMVLEEGTGWCSGNLINTLAADGRPFLLTANHCFSDYTPLFDLWRFDFNFEHPGCSNENTVPLFQSLLGAQLRAAWQDTDFALFELDNAVPRSYDAYFNGWNADENVPLQSTFIHHPRGDVKKLTLKNSPSIIFSAPINWNNDIQTPANHHFRVTMNEGGGFDVGSSGGALINQGRQIVGQLHGGFPDSLCRVSTAYFGRLHLSWEGGGTPETRLKDWLDPQNTGRMWSNGIENPNEDAITQRQGNVQTPSGEPISGVQIMMNESEISETDLAGNYLIENLAVGTTYTFSAQKEDDPRNGTSARDLILMQKHILNFEAFTSPYQLIAADIDRSKRLSAFDLLQLHKVILSRSPDFENNTTWQFIPQPYEANVADFDFEYSTSQTWTASTTAEPLRFIGVKTGDVNESANLED